MEDYRTPKDQGIWKESFTLACFIYSVTDGDSFAPDPELRCTTRRIMVRVLSSIMEGFESADPVEREKFLSRAALASGELRQLLLKGYQGGCLSFKEFSRAREQCLRLRCRLLDPGMENVG